MTFLDSDDHCGCKDILEGLEHQKQLDFLGELVGIGGAMFTREFPQLAGSQLNFLCMLLCVVRPLDFALSPV